MKQIGLLVLAAVLLGSESVSTIGRSSAHIDAFRPSTGWHKVDAGAFSIYAPQRWEFPKRQGIDSYVWEFVDNGVVLRFDFGRYSHW